jgi:hypothetical protein
MPTQTLAVGTPPLSLYTLARVRLLRWLPFDIIILFTGRRVLRVAHGGYSWGVYGYCLGHPSSQLLTNAGWIPWALFLVPAPSLRRARHTSIPGGMLPSSRGPRDQSNKHPAMLLFSDLRGTSLTPDRYYGHMTLPLSRPPKLPRPSASTAGGPIA